MLLESEPVLDSVHSPNALVMRRSFFCRPCVLTLATVRVSELPYVFLLLTTKEMYTLKPSESFGCTRSFLQLLASNRS